MVKSQFFRDAGHAVYKPMTDRSYTGPGKWDLGAPDGPQRLEDMLMAATNSYTTAL